MKRVFNAYLESDEEKLFNDLTDLASKIASAYANRSIILDALLSFLNFPVRTQLSYDAEGQGSSFTPH